ncbi:MAG: universal stress protein [Candidatus Bathyarchaeota archaeon]|nr:universal stress protein [Candidatus Bathyarchaeota archaeon]MDH5494461.1 universal stress protein [Candidatus Bathyarchaeota archaeon]
MSTNVSITKILVPVDGSKPSDKAAEYAIDIAKRVKANIVAVHVIHLPAYALTPTPIEGMPTHMMTPIPMTISNEERKMAENYMNKVKKMAKRAKVKIETKIVEDQPSIVHAITKIAEKEGCDLIVMGTKGRTGIKRFLLGSVANGVLTYAPCPVLVVR